MKSLYKFIIVLVLAASFLAGCGTEDDSSKTPEDVLTVYTTIYPLEDFTKKIGGEFVEVKSIFPPGVDAHTYEPTAKMMVDIAKADALIYTGIGLEGFMNAASDTLKKENVKIIKVADGLEGFEETEGHHEEDEHEEHSDHDEGEHNHGDEDPHIWLDPLIAIEMADTVYHELVTLKPEGEEVFKQNFTKLKSELEKLDQEFIEAVQNSSKKEILVSHAAYGYWEKRYGIEQISISGLSPTNEPTQKDLKKVIDTAKEHDIKYVIVEQNVSSKMTDSVKKELQAETLVLRNLESISYEDSESNEDYFSLMRKNIKTLKTALN
ncbi:adhesin [Bacillus sp. BGMRC 2118]|nr:adhesin [Bacillus sp. BGMRC 2118]